MPVKTHLANAARRRFYYIAATAQPSITPAHPFFDAGYTPSTSPRLVNTAQITLHSQQGPAPPNAPGQQAQTHGKGGSSGQGSGQHTTGTLVLPLPAGSEGAPLGAGANGRSTGAEGYGGAAGSLLVPTPGNFSPPCFFPSILGSSERAQAQARGATFRLESGAYGIPKSRPRTQTQTSTPGASTSAAAPSVPSPSTSTASPPREVLDLSCQIGDDAYFVRSVSTFPSFPTAVSRDM